MGYGGGVDGGGEDESRIHLPEASLDWIKEYQISSALLLPHHNEAWPPYLYLKKHAIIKPDFLVAQLSHSTSPT